MSSMETVYKKVSAFLDHAKGRRLLIQTHDIPDPDALASAEALRLIARNRGINARIVINGLPHRRENIAFMKECRINVHPLESVKIRKPDRVAWAYVDCMPGRGNVTLHRSAPGGLFLAIDHHGRDEELASREGAYLAVYPDAGATATLLGELLFAFEVPFPPRIGAALSYAIITDTQDFSRGAHDADLDMYTRLFTHTNQRIISRLRNTTKPRDYFRTMSLALERARTFRNLAWVNLGEVTGGEMVAAMADFILSCERITWAFALGWVGDRMMISLRAARPTAHCGYALRRILPPALGTSGGHDQLAGGFTIVEPGTDPDILARELIRRYIATVLSLPQNTPAPEGTPLVEEKEAKTTTVGQG